MEDRNGKDALTPAEWSSMAALVETLFPSEPDGVGAVEAGVLTYMERLLAKQGDELAHIYRSGLSWFDDQARQLGPAGFVHLGPDDQEKLVESLMNASEGVTIISGGPSSSHGMSAERSGAELAGAQVPPPLGGGTSGPSPEYPDHVSEAMVFMGMVWQHVREGLFADPRHGGNKGAMVWQWMGYNGPQLNGYTDSEIMENVIPRRPLKMAEDWKNHRE